MANKYIGCKCQRGYEVQVLRSGAGYYLGTLDEDGFPNCRVSSCYAKTMELADGLKPDRICIENTYCSGGTGCEFERMEG